MTADEMEARDKASEREHSWQGHATQTEANACAICRELPPAAKLMPGERLVDGEVLYSADWLSDKHDESQPVSFLEKVSGNFRDYE